MDVLLYLVLMLLYFAFAGFGLTHYLLKSSDKEFRTLMVLPLGYALTVVSFSEPTQLLSSPSLGFIVAIGAAITFNVLVIRNRIRGTGPNLKEENNEPIKPLAQAFLFSAAVVLIVGISFFLSGWSRYWGSGNMDIMDGLRGRDFLFENTTEFFEQRHGYYQFDPFAWFQYSSLAFMSSLLSSSYRANVFHLHGLIMLFMTFLGVFFLSKRGLGLTAPVSLLAAAISSLSSFYVSTYYTGHEGSIVFGAVFPFAVALCLIGIHQKRSDKPLVLSLALLMYTLLRTYPYPAIFTLVPLIVYWALLSARSGILARPVASLNSVLNSVRRRGPNNSLMLTIALVFVGCMVAVVVLQSLWHYFEPMRDNLSGRPRSWGIANYKEMFLLYWGLAPAPIAFGLGGASQVFVPAVLFLAYTIVFMYTMFVVAGLWMLIKERSQLSLFLLIYVGFWLISFAFMKIVVGDPYYLYKFLYTNFFMIAIVFTYGLSASLGTKGGTARHTSIQKALASIFIAVYFLTNVGLLAVYNFDSMSRAYNGKSSGRFWEVDSLKQFAKAGLLFSYASNNFNDDYGNVVSYILERQHIATQPATGSFGYELKIKLSSDVFRKRVSPDTVRVKPVWENEVYAVTKTPSKDLLIPLETKFRTLSESWYRPEKYDDAYSGYPFRWVSYKLKFYFLHPSNTVSYLGFCVEPGPGFDNQPFGLKVYISGKTEDSTFARGNLVEEFATYRNLTLLDSLTVSALQYHAIQLPKLDESQALVTIIADREGKNLLPWEERYLNYRVALVGLTDRRIDPDAVKLMNARVDIVPLKTWQTLQSAGTASSAEDLLTIWNNWGPVETQYGQRFRWVSNDAELLLFHPTEKSKYLNMMVAPGQTFPSHQAKLYVEVNSRGVDSLSLNGYQRLKVRLPGNLQAENVIRLHLDRTAKPTEEDPRILSFRVFRAFLSEN